LQVELPLPDHAARKKIFEVHVRDRRVAPDVDVSRLADQTEGFSGADIEGACRRAMMEVIAECIAASPDAPDASKLVLGNERLEDAIRRLAPQTAQVKHD
jgi:transitional endoplasmic reticulum ATPase